MGKTFWAQRVLASATLILFAMLPARAGEGAAAFNADGSITCGSNSIYLNSNGFLTINAGNVKLSGHMPLFEVNPATKERRWFTTTALEDKSLNVDMENKKTVFKGTYRPKATGKSMGVTITVSLGDDGMVKVEPEINPKDLFKEGLVAGGGFHIKSPYDYFIGHSIEIDESVFKFNKGERPEPVDLRGTPDKIVFFAGNPAMRIIFLPLHKNDGIHFAFTAPSDVVLSLPHFKLDLGIQGRTGKTDRVVNYYPTDDLHGPRYDLCRNLVQNPSFEAGFRYWRSIGGQNFPNPDNFCIDSSVSFRGKKSLRLYGKKGRRIGMGYLATFAIPVEPGKDYTLSFYARGDSAQKLHVSSQEGRGNLIVSNSLTVALNNDAAFSPDWKRHSFTFKTKDNILSIVFNIQYPTEDCTAWIDCVQLEKGPLTDYVEKPVCAELVTDHFDNLFQPGETMNARLEIHTLPGMKGKAEFSLKDFFGREVYKGSADFLADKDGLALCSIPFEQEQLPSGAYGLKADFTLESGFSDQDYFRLGSMDYLDNKFKHKNMFGVGAASAVRPDVNFERMKHIGLGAALTVAFNPLETIPPEARENNILLFSSIFRLGDYVGESPGKEELDKDYRKGPKEWIVGEQCGLRPGEKGFDPDIIPLPAVEESCRKKAAAHPEMKYWKLVNEPPAAFGDNINAAKKYVAIMKAAYDGIKRGNPDAVVLSPDPSNIIPSHGARRMDTYLAAGGIHTFDIVAIHIYRKLPEDPDLDLDVASFISMLDKHGYNGEIWFTEGFMFIDYILPMYGLDAIGDPSCDFRCGSISYDIGYGEKLVAAYAARTWLVCLKYSSRVRMGLAWWPQLSNMDINMTPHVDAWVPNTLGHVLGNADFKQDIVVSDDVRCYVFENEKKQPVAVFWNTSQAVDRKVRQGSVLKLPFKKDEIEIIDLMGKNGKLADNGELMITPFPVFVKGKSGTTASFCERLSKDLAGAEVTRVKPTIKMLAPGKAGVDIQNVLPVEIKGRVSIQCQGKTVVDENVRLGGKELKTFVVPVLRTSNLFDKISICVSYLPEGQSLPQVKDATFTLITCKKRKGAITVDGDLSDWSREFAVSLPNVFKEFPVPAGLVSKFAAPIPWKGEDDLSAVLYSCWDEENLYFAVKVKDDALSRAPSDARGKFNYDSLQVYFDTFCDARNKGYFKGFDENDYNYSFYPAENGSLEAVRDWVPDRQIAFLEKGSAPEVRRAFKKVDDGMVYEIAFPARQIIPISLKQGSSFGFALLINDNDNDYRKRGLTLTPQGTEPYMRPDLYPVMCLE